jgi:hypothetical protein
MQHSKESKAVSISTPRSPVKLPGITGYRYFSALRIRVSYATYDVIIRYCGALLTTAVPVRTHSRPGPSSFCLRPYRGVDRGQEPRVIGRPVQQHLIQVGQDQARPGTLTRQRPQGGASQRGAPGGRGALAAHSSDHHSPGPPNRWEHVAEVRGNLRRGPADRVPRGHLQAWEIQKPRRGLDLSGSSLIRHHEEMPYRHNSRRQVSKP